ncbi:MAG TPA: hypothetical protein DCM08_09580 [Microscillaceae bacterium]|jgi:uncharacterized protein (DUF427 family)|nr:hypothetical protein [Microscillaceae bacterium]
MKAIYKGQVIAESNNTIVIEGNHYFPPNSVNTSYLRASALHTTCPWKGVASYYHIVVDEHENKDAAWYYPQASEKAKSIEGYIAFWKGVEVVE